MLTEPINIHYIRERFGEGHLYFASHAAFPLTFTPDLLYRLWANFQQDVNGESLHIPWVAIADILFSGLCDEIGHELYEMNQQVREHLLRDLRRNPRFGEQRLQELAVFLLTESQFEINSTNMDVRDLAQVHQWTALAYTNTREAVQSIAQSLAKLSIEDTAEWARMTSLVEAIREPLIVAHQEALLMYVRGMLYVARDDLQKAIAAFSGLSIQEQTVNIAGVSLPIPLIFEHAQNASLFSLVEYKFDSVGIVQRNKRFVSSWQIVRSPRVSKLYYEDWDVGFDLEMVFIPGGSFLIGSLDHENLEVNEQPRQVIQIATLFMSKYPITQIQWRIVASLPKVSIDLDPDPAFFKGPHKPVENVNWFSAIEFCNRLQLHTKKSYRLPTEGEWEYACRAGTTTPFHFGEVLTSKLACYDGTKQYGHGPTGKRHSETTTVGYFNAANDFGLHDMHGNVWEWCNTKWIENRNFFMGDYLEWRNRIRECVMRGGSWASASSACRSANRNKNNPTYKSSEVGFRVAVSN